MMTLILTKRLIIRPILDTDLDTVLSFMSLPVTFRFISEQPLNEEKVRSMIERGQNNPNRNGIPTDNAVTLKETGELIGLLSFYTINSRFRTVEIGWIFHPDYRGQGYASESARALVNYGFRVLGLHRIIATCDPRNIPSVRIMEKLGMRREGEFLDSVLLAEGEWHHEYFYAITEKEWLIKTP